MNDESLEKLISGIGQMRFAFQSIGFDPPISIGVNYQPYIALKRYGDSLPYLEKSEKVMILGIEIKDTTP